ncbi:MAG: preprotein translocase subunit YajC [Actinobacteria bacterium]|nr:preprotein translocase subunit YajC [Actinomycetota bacterium]
MSSLVAAGSSSSGSNNLLIFALPLLLIGFMFITQRRRTKDTQRLQSSLSVGDEVTTTSGLLGRISALDDVIATLEVSPGVTIRFNRRAIAGPAPTASVSPTASASGESETDEPSDPTRLTD